MLQGLGGLLVLFLADKDARQAPVCRFDESFDAGVLGSFETHTRILFSLLQVTQGQPGAPHNGQTPAFVIDLMDAIQDLQRLLLLFDGQAQVAGARRDFAAIQVYLAQRPQIVMWPGFLLQRIEPFERLRHIFLLIEVHQGDVDKSRAQFFGIGQAMDKVHGAGRKFAKEGAVALLVIAAGDLLIHQSDLE